MLRTETDQAVTEPLDLITSEVLAVAAERLEPGTGTDGLLALRDVFRDEDLGLAFSVTRV